MSIFTGTYTAYAAKGQREALEDTIYDISPVDTPFMSNAAKSDATAVLEEWQTDVLASAVTTNQQLEGDEASFSAPTATVRVGNYCQIAKKTALVSGTLEKVSKAGRKSEMAYQIARRASEIKRDMEAHALANVGGSAGSENSSARVAASLGAWVKSNTVKSTGGGDPAYTTGVPSAARTDATTTNQVTFTETMLKSACQKVWASGGDLKVLMVGPFNKGLVSGFTGIATRTYQLNAPAAEPIAIIGAADVYVSDFGTLHVIPNRFQRERDAWLLDFDYISFAYLRPFETIQIAKTGDAEKRLLQTEYTLKIHNEKALGLVADLTTS